MEDITADYAVETIAPSAELRVRLQVQVAQKTDMGRVRENNEDKAEFYLPDTDADAARRGSVFIMCDGMGGHEAGQIASEVACKTWLDVYYAHPSESVQTAALQATLAANRFVLDRARANPQWKGMGTTLSALALVQDQAVIAHVGDSRIYRLRGGEIEMLTRDHTWVEETVSQGIMSREEAERHPYKHVILRAIGTQDALEVDVLSDIVLPNDIYMLCSDGVTNHVSLEQIQEVLSQRGPSPAAGELVRMALADGGSDNATVLVVHVQGLEPLA